MARIKINDLPKNQKLSHKNMKEIMGGYSVQRAYSSLKEKPRSNFLTNPWILGAAVAAAIAVPIAIDDSDDGS